MIPPLACTLAILAIMAPRIMGGALTVFTLFVLASLAPVLRQHIYNWRALLAPAVTLAVFALTALWSPSPRRFEMLRDASYVLTAGALLLVTLPAWPDALIRRTINWMMAGLAVATLVFAQQYATDFSLTRWFSQLPPGGNLMQTNLPKRTACTIALLLWPLLLYVSRSVPAGTGRLMNTLLALSLLVLVYDLGSRTALVGTLAAFAAFGIAQWRLQLGQAVGFIMLPLAVPLSLLAARALPAIIHPAIDHSTQERLAIWHETLHQLTWPRILYGVGLDGSRDLSNLIQDHPHNVYLQIVLEGGLPGALLAITLAALLWRFLRHVDSALQPYIWAQVTAASITLSLAYGMWQGWWLGAHLTAAFLLALIVRHEDTSDHATPADQR